MLVVNLYSSMFYIRTKEYTTDRWCETFDIKFIAIIFLYNLNVCFPLHRLLLSIITFTDFA